MISRLTQRFSVHTGTITNVAQITPRMRQIRITDPLLQDLPWQAGQQVRVRLGAGTMRPRSYTVRHYDSQAGSLDLWILLHGVGPGSQWAASAEEGMTVSFLGPMGSFVLTEETPGYYLFAGEETAAVCLQTMLEALPATAIVLGCLETNEPGEEIPTAGPHQLPWVYRANTPALTSPNLIAAIQALQLPDAPGRAYLAGEARACQAIRRYLLTEKHWPRTAIHTKPFWTPGRIALD